MRKGLIILFLLLAVHNVYSKDQQIIGKVVTCYPPLKDSDSRYTSVETTFSTQFLWKGIDFQKRNIINNSTSNNEEGPGPTVFSDTGVTSSTTAITLTLKALPKTYTNVRKNHLTMGSGIATTDVVGYGSYSFNFLLNNILYKNVTFKISTFDKDYGPPPSGFYREWAVIIGSQACPYDGKFVVQPEDQTGYVAPFFLNYVTNLTVNVNWSPTCIVFTALNNTKNNGSRITTWRFVNARPVITGSSPKYVPLGNQGSSLAKIYLQLLPNYGSPFPSPVPTVVINTITYNKWFSIFVPYMKFPGDITVNDDDPYEQLITTASTIPSTVVIVPTINGSVTSSASVICPFSSSTLLAQKKPVWATWANTIKALRAGGVKVLGYVQAGANTVKDITSWNKYSCFGDIDGIFLNGVKTESTTVLKSYRTSTTNFTTASNKKLWISTGVADEYLSHTYTDDVSVDGVAHIVDFNAIGGNVNALSTKLAKIKKETTNIKQPNYKAVVLVTNINPAAYLNSVTLDKTSGTTVITVMEQIGYGGFFLFPTNSILQLTTPNYFSALVSYFTYDDLKNPSCSCDYNQVCDYDEDCSTCPQDCETGTRCLLGDPVFFSADEVNSITQQHNDIRDKYKVDPIKYDFNIAARAEDYARSCKFEHSKGAIGTNVFYGENLAQISGYGSNIDVDISGWLEEEKDYKCDQNKCYADTSSDQSNYVCGHFQQIIDKKATTFGCGKAICYSNAPQSDKFQITTGSQVYGISAWLYLVCQYEPFHDFNKESPTDQCPEEDKSLTLQCQSTDTAIDLATLPTDTYISSDNKVPYIGSINCIKELKIPTGYVAYLKIVRCKMNPFNTEDMQNSDRLEILKDDVLVATIYNDAFIDNTNEFFSLENRACTYSNPVIVELKGQSATLRFVTFNPYDNIDDDKHSGYKLSVQLEKIVSSGN